MATDQFDAGVRATNALSALNEFYSHEFARAVEAYKGLEQLHQTILKQLVEARREAAAGSALADAVGRAEPGSKDIEKALDRYEQAVGEDG